MHYVSNSLNRIKQVPGLEFWEIWISSDIISGCFVKFLIFVQNFN